MLCTTTFFVGDQLSIDFYGGGRRIVVQPFHLTNLSYKRWLKWALTVIELSWEITPVGITMALTVASWVDSRPYQQKSRHTEQKVGCLKKVARNSWFLMKWTLACLMAPRLLLRVMAPSSARSFSLTETLGSGGQNFSKIFSVPLPTHTNTYLHVWQLSLWHKCIHVSTRRKLLKWRGYF